MDLYCRHLLPLLLLFTLGSRLPAQFLPEPVNNERTTEVSGVSIPGNQSIYVSAMEKELGVEETAIYRSTAGGPWVEFFRLLPSPTYDRAPDPVMAFGGNGRLYCALMRIPSSSGFVSHIELYGSDNQGTSWNLLSTPYFQNNFGDYPAILAGDDDFVAISYSEYTSSPLDSWVEFVRSTDGGVTWSAPARFDGNRAWVGSNFITVGSDMAWVGNRLCLSYGDYNVPQMYFAQSTDSGATWSSPQTVALSTSDNFLVTKLVTHPQSDTIFLIGHRPHDNYATIHVARSLDGGANWTSQVAATMAAYGEGIQSAPGVLDLVYNETDALNNFSIRYTWSTDAGQTFAPPVTLWSAPQNHQGAGEYQVFVPSASGVGFDLAFIDDSDSSDVKYLHFTHALQPVGVDDPSQEIVSIFPNPAHDVLQLQYTGSAPEARYIISDLQGKRLRSGPCAAGVTAIDIQEFPSGAYLLLLEAGPQITVQKFVKQ